MTDYLDLEARLETPWVHPGGAIATKQLLDVLRLEAEDRVLDLGCGTGATAAAAAASGASVVALDLRPGMLAAARARSTLPLIVRADATIALPFVDHAFDAAWAESVVALLDPASVVAEMCRVVRPGGRIVLNERIWRSGISADEAAQINTLSIRCFGITAAAVEPLDRNAWIDLLEGLGLRLERVTTVAELSAHRQLPDRAGWLARQRSYLASPGLLVRSLRWRWLIRRYRSDWSKLDSWFFVAERPP